MILSNLSILSAIASGDLNIEGLNGLDPTKAPFNTSSVDLRLGATIVIPKKFEEPIDLRHSYPSSVLTQHSKHVTLTEREPFILEPGQFVLGNTLERVTFPRKIGRPAYSGRVEGKSSRARFGLAVHITAPTIHNDFSGTVTLEIMNFGQSPIFLHPGVYICQLIVEQLDAVPFSAPNQFSGQSTPIG